MTSTLPTIARPAGQIGAELDGLYAQMSALRDQVRPLLLELLRAKVHAVVPDAQSVTLYADEWDNGWFYGDDAEVASTDGTVTPWDEAVADEVEGGGLDEVLLANVSDAFGAHENRTLTIDLVHLTVS